MSFCLWATPGIAPALISGITPDGVQWTLWGVGHRLQAGCMQGQYFNVGSFSACRSWNNSSICLPSYLAMCQSSEIFQGSTGCGTCPVLNSHFLAREQGPGEFIAGYVYKSSLFLGVLWSAKANWEWL